LKYNLINEQNDIQNSLDQILINRNITSPFSNFLNPSFLKANHYKKLNNIPLAIQILKIHLDKNHNVAIIVDSDCDGYFSSAIMWSYIKSVYPDSNLI